MTSCCKLSKFHRTILIKLSVSWIDLLTSFTFFSSYYIVDTMVGLCIAIVTIGTIWPIAACSGKVLLHSTPPYLLSQLDKILSEAQTLGKLPDSFILEVSF